MNLLDLAEAVGRKPNSSALRSMITSSSKYGLTEGGFKNSTVRLTERGLSAVAPRDEVERAKALLDAAIEPLPFKRFYTRYDRNRMPQDQIAMNMLEREFGIPSEVTAECLDMIKANAVFAGMFKEISGSLYINLNAAPGSSVGGVTTALEVGSSEGPEGEGDDDSKAETASPPSGAQRNSQETAENRRIFIGHDSNTKPVEQLEKVLTRFKIAFARAVYEPNRARPISQKVADTMRSCNASILVFTADQEFSDTDGNTVWRPSENVVHELGAASVLHGERIVIFKEEAVNLPSNFRDIGYISFEKDRLDAKGVELISELIAFGVLSVNVG